MNEGAKQRETSVVQDKLFSHNFCSQQQRNPKETLVIVALSEYFDFIRVRHGSTWSQRGRSFRGQRMNALLLFATSGKNWSI